MAKTSKSRSLSRSTPAAEILRDRVLVSALLFGAAGYIVSQSLAGAAMLASAFILAAIWSFRTAGSHPNPGIRVMGLLMLMTLGTFMTMYIAINQGSI